MAEVGAPARDVARRLQHADWRVRHPGARPHTSPALTHEFLQKNTHFEERAQRATRNAEHEHSRSERSERRECESVDAVFFRNLINAVHSFVAHHHHHHTPTTTHHPPTARVLGPERPGKYTKICTWADRSGTRPRATWEIHQNLYLGRPRPARCARIFTGRLTHFEERAIKYPEKFAKKSRKKYEKLRNSSRFSLVFQRF